MRKQDDVFDRCGILLKNKTILNMNDFTKACLLLVVGYSLY